MPAGGGIWQALERGAALGCEIVQLFVKNNMQWSGRPHSPENCARFAQQLSAGRFACVFGHTGYLINLAAPASENRDKSIQSLIQEINLAASLGLPFLVMHPGSHLGKGEAKGLRSIVAGLNEVFRSTPLPVRIGLENTAGQGSCLGHRLEHLATIFDSVDRPERLGICLDTAHFFEAGYEIQTPQGWHATIKQVEALIGLKQVLAFHLNDSKTPLRSRVDRHAGIGQGFIGREGFRHIVNDLRFRDLPGCLETPKSKDQHEDRENLAMLRLLTQK